MRFTRFRSTALTVSLLVAVIPACFSATAPGDAAGAPDAGTSDPGSGEAGTTTTTTGQQSAFALGQSVAQSYACVSCHGADLSGNIKQSSGVYSANLTPDMATGIGSWTLANLTSALRDGTDDQGDMICSAMPKFPSISDDDIVDLYAYLQGIPAVSKAQTNTDCQGNPVSGDDDDSGAGDDDAAPDGGVDAGDPCPHKVCVEGAALAPSCGACAAAVCSHDSACCETSWSSACVAEVDQYCVTQCN